MFIIVRSLLLEEIRKSVVWNYKLFSNVVIISFVNVSEIGNDVTKGGSKNANFLGDELFMLLKKEMLSNKKEDMS